MSTVRSQVIPKGALLAGFFHYRWALPVLAELHRGHGAKFITLLNRLELGRSTLRRTLDVLLEWGWVLPNPGHGHPMRPEYILSARGKALGAAGERLHRALLQAELTELALRKWSMPIVYTLSIKERRYGELEAALPGSNPRALTRALKDLCEGQLIQRSILHNYPPVPLYAMTPERGEITNPLVDLAQGLVAA